VTRLIDEAVAAGARQSRACAEVGITERTLQRWRTSRDDRRAQARPPSNRLSDEERQHVLQIVNSPEFCDLSPKQIVPILADRGVYVASESTLYRLMRAAKLLRHRGASRPPTARRSREHVAEGPNQVWSWDITYLRSPIRGAFYYLYLVEDIWSRKVVSWEVHECESSELAGELIRRACAEEGIGRDTLVLHSDNGGPMKGSTMLATLQSLGVAPSFNRPSVSNDNPFSESLFKTCKYRPSFPSKPFASLDAARTWVQEFVRWYNTEHLHSGIRFVTPHARHSGAHRKQLATRHLVYQAARQRTPRRWSRATRDWSDIPQVKLNPAKQRAAAMAA
jgi:putative transposase